jgi:hypothetical protein
MYAYREAALEAILSAKDLLKMFRAISRRGMLKNAAAGSGALLSRGLELCQETPIQIPGHQVEIALTPVSPHTVRITIQALEDGHLQAMPIDGALVKESLGQPVARLRTNSNPGTVKCAAVPIRRIQSSVPL